MPLNMVVSQSARKRSGILYQNETADAILIDIPLSIAGAQACSRTLQSTPPLESPFETVDRGPPQGRTTKKNTGSDEELQLHEEYKELISEALQYIHMHVSGSWCAPREVVAHVSKHDHDKDSMHMDIDNPEKDLELRLREWASSSTQTNDMASNLQMMMASLGAESSGSTSAHPWTMSYRLNTDLDNAHDAYVLNEPFTATFHNAADEFLALIIRGTQPDQEYRFTIPRRSTFFLSDCGQPHAFRASFRERTDAYALPRHFDLVLLDPPWPNRSAKRKHAYDQSGGMPRMMQMLFKMDIDTYLEHNALVGIWITNKNSLREHVLGKGGLFERWNVGLMEEWIWIKTTTKGEPMFDIEHDSRRPYEIFLLGQAAPNAWTTMQHSQNVKRRVIAAVPDIHSRKPCLKELLETYLPDANDYSALEVFSRYLVSGWTSWGNEVLKYNNEMYWAQNKTTTPDG